MQAGQIDIADSVTTPWRSVCDNRGFDPVVKQGCTRVLRSTHPYHQGKNVK